MKLLIFVSSYTALFFVVHLIWWRIRRPVQQKQALLGLFLIPLFMFSALQMLGFREWLPTSLQMGLSELIVGNILMVGMILSYLISYTLVETEGPTFLILLAFDRAKETGLSSEQLLSIITDDLFVKHRIQGLFDDQLVVDTEYGYKITAKGQRTLSLFMIPRMILGLKCAGG